jgi:hypothetical protein
MEAIKKDLPAAKAGKTFDAVKMMRDIRDKVSAETQNMSFAELKEYIQAKLKESKLKPVGQ